LIPTLHIYLFGDLNLMYDDAPVTTLSSARLQSLLAYLVLHRDAPQSRRHLSFLFWPDSSETQARTNLRKLLYDLRHALPDAHRFLDVDGPALQWRTDAPFTLDVADFENALSHAASPAEFQEAVDLYQGDLLPSCYDDWILPERERLRQMYADALSQLITMLESQRDYRTAIGYAHRLLQHDPLQEDTYRLLMQLYALSGDRAGALRTYHACVTALRRELQVEPSPATREMYQRVLDLDLSLAQLPMAVPKLEGRNREWVQLEAAWHDAAAGQPQWVLLTGEEGIGKTRLVEEFLHWAARQGIATASTRCYAAESSLAFAPVAAWLRARSLPRLDRLWLSEIARLLPELLVKHPDLPAPGPLTEPWQRHRFFEALVRAVLAIQPVLLLIDDLQWCDRDTLEWLQYLMRFDSKARLLLLGTLCPEDLKADHPLTALLPALRRNGQFAEIALAPLGEFETSLLATTVGGRELQPTAVAQLFQETRGNPLFTLEMVRAGLSDAAHPAPAAPPPRTVQTAIAARLAQLSPAARELSGVAATFGRAFTCDVLARASNAHEDELVRGLDELWNQQIIREHARDAYDFSHAKLGEVAYTGLSATRRELLHRKVAEALEETADDNLDLVSGEIAAHFEQAGLVDRAIPYYIRAGDAARRVYANEVAINYYQRALALLPENEHIDVMLKLGEVWQLIGNWTEAEALFRQALHLAEKAGDPRAQARCEAALGEVLHLKGSYNEALSWLERARSGFEALGDLQGVCQVLEYMGTTHYWQLDHIAALQCHERQLRIASQIGDKQAVSKAHGTLGLVYWQQGDYPRALANLEQQLQIANEIGDLSGVSNALGAIGLIHWTQGDYPRALGYFEQQLQIANEIGDRLAVGYALRNIGVVHLEQGDYPHALAYATQQLQISSELGDRRGMSYGMRNLGVVYYEQGDSERALTCYAQSLQIAVEASNRRTISRALGNIAIVYTGQRRYDEAGHLYQQVRALVPASALPYSLCKYLYYNAGLYVRQERYAEAQSLNDDALRIAGEIGRRDIQFKAQLLSIRLRVALGITNLPTAVAELETLLGQWSEGREQAAIQYELWRLDERQESARRTATELYRRLYAQTPSAEYRHRYQELSGERLPDPPPLPELPDIVTRNPVDLVALLAQVDEIVAQLNAPAMQPETLSYAVVAEA
jgi:DNA-binding SARP family transcriptional activator/Tfp pilus assembly protein PilF